MKQEKERRKKLVKIEKHTSLLGTHYEVETINITPLPVAPICKATLGKKKDTEVIYLNRSYED